MQADNDNLDGCVSGVDDWESLHEAVRKVVESMASRQAPHQVGEEQVWETPLTQGGPVYGPTGRATEDHDTLGNESVGSVILRLVR